MIAFFFQNRLFVHDGLQFFLLKKLVVFSQKNFPIKVEKTVLRNTTICCVFKNLPHLAILKKFEVIFQKSPSVLWRKKQKFVHFEKFYYLSFILRQIY